MVNKNYYDKLTTLLVNTFVPAGYTITQPVQVDTIPQNSAYDALSFALNNKNIVYRKAKITPDRPGAFLTLWQRPSLALHCKTNKPIPLTANDLDYLFVHVQLHPSLTVIQQSLNIDEVDKNHDNQRHGTNEPYGIFIFPVALLIEKGIVYSNKSKGKTAFRVFPPWSQDKGEVATKVFSDSAKKTQAWQLRYFIAIDEHGFIDTGKLHKLLK